MTTAEPPVAPGAERTRFWARSARAWDVAFYLMAAIGALAMSTDPGTTGAGRTLSVTALAALVVAHTLLARRAARTASRRYARAYLAVLLVAVAVAVLASEVGSLLLFIAYSQVWYLTASRRSGTVLSVLLTGAVLAASAVREDVRWGAGLDALVVQSAISLAFAVLLGLWITHVIERGEERAELLARLEEAQAELAASHRAAGAAAERERLAREIHDTLAQGFTSLVMLAQTAAADLDRDDVGRARERLELVERTARENLAEARALVAASAPIALQGATLVDALDRLAGRFHEETGVVVEVDLPGGVVPLGREAEVVLLRAAQEALANIRRHAGARRVRLALRADNDLVLLDVVDDGSGIAEGAVEGYGLRGMRDRVTAVGGRVNLGTDEPQGTRLSVELPTSTAAERRMAT